MDYLIPLFIKQTIETAVDDSRQLRNPGDQL